MNRKYVNGTPSDPNYTTLNSGATQGNKPGNMNISKSYNEDVKNFNNNVPNNLGTPVNPYHFFETLNDI